MPRASIPKPKDTAGQPREGLPAKDCSPSLQFALAELADWAQLEAKAADSQVSQGIWLQVRDWARNGARYGKTPKAKHPLPPDTDILEALEARIPGIIAIGARWARKANDKGEIPT